MRQLERSRADSMEDARVVEYLPPAYGEFELAAAPNTPPSHYAWVVRRQKWKVLTFVAACVLATYLYCARLTPIYRATSVIDVDRQLPSMAMGPEAAQSLASEDSTEFLTTQGELIQSDAVVRPVALKYNLLQVEEDLDRRWDAPAGVSEGPITLRHLSVTRAIDTYILKINYESSDRRLAAAVANDVAESYLRHTFEIKINSTLALSKFMERQLDELRAKMERSGMALAKFEQELNVVNPEQQTNILSARLLQLNTEYTNAQADRVRREAAFNGMKGHSVAAAQASSQGEQLTALYDRVNEAKQHLADVGSVYGPGHAEHRKAASSLAEVQRQFEEMQRNVIERVNTDYQNAVSRERMLEKTVKDAKTEWDQLNSRSFEYDQLKRGADADKTLYGDLERRIREAGINAGFQNSSIRIADYARPAVRPIAPKIKRDTLIALAVALILGIFGVVLADILDNTIRDPEQVARALDVNVLGALPLVKNMKRLNAPYSIPIEMPMMNASQDQPKSQIGKRAPKPSYLGIASFEEAIRTLRHSILLPDPDRTIRSILLTSAMPGDGKSITILHLALAHAAQGKPTLIIDADLRRPSIHKKLGIDGTLGLSNVLLNKVPWRDTVVHSQSWPCLDVLPAGLTIRRASDAIGSRMLDIVEEASQDYDLILVDAPPLLGFAEAMQIATAVDGVVVIARAGQTNRRSVGTVLATLRRLRANTLGLVLNEVDRNTTHGYYDYQKYYTAPKPG